MFSGGPNWWCITLERTYVLPTSLTPLDQQCTDAYPPAGFWVDDEGDPEAGPHLQCAMTFDDEAVVLPYGLTLNYHDMICTSAEDGMSCESALSGHGFRLSRSDYELF